MSFNPESQIASPPGIAKRRANEMILAGLLTGGIAGFGEVIPAKLPFYIIKVTSFGFLFSSFITELVFFLLSVCLNFFILYIWGSKRVGRFLKEKYPRIFTLLFLGGMIGFAAVYYGYNFRAGAAIPTLTSSFYWLVYSFQTVQNGLSVTFLGFTAIGLAYFRKS